MKKIKIKKTQGSKPQLPKGGYGFMIGNGTSRKDLSLKPLMDYGILAACNWFFKEEFRPHVLVASDEPMTQTILKTQPNFAKRNWFVTWFPKPGSGAKKATCPEKFAAGPMGTEYLANVHECQKVFLIGMDFFGYGSSNKNQNGMMNNLYQGKKHYAKDEKAGAPTYRNWQRRFEWILKNYPDRDFYHVNPFEGKSPERLRGYPNFHQVTWDNLMDHLENDAELVDILETNQDDVDLIKMPNEDDLRATIERQIAGQENIIYNDILSDEEVIKIRKLGSEAYAKNSKQFASIKVLGFDILLPQLGVKEGNIVRPANEKELKIMYSKEKNDRAKLKEESNVVSVDIIKREPPKQQSLPVPPPPPPNALEGLPLPPPPPPS